MTDILKTSKLIKSMFEDEINDGEEIDYKLEMQTLFNMFSSNKQLKITFKNVEQFLIKFDIFYKNNYFKTFVVPSIQEYFCKRLNTLLIIDFVISFFKTINNSFNINTDADDKLITNLFTKLGDFFSFMNYLDVDEDFMNYLKYMLTLYLIQKDRPFIEDNFRYSIEILDDFFRNDIITKLCHEYVFHNNKFTFYQNILRDFPEEFKEYNKDIDYTSKEYDFLSSLFYMCTTWMDRTMVEPVTKEEVVPDNEEVEYDSDDSDMTYDSAYDTYCKKHHHIEHIPIIKSTDDNYILYRKQFIFRSYQKSERVNKQFFNTINHLKISEYSKLHLNDKCEDIYYEILKLQTVLGLKIDVQSIEYDHFKEKTYELACKFGHFEIAKQYIVQLKDKDKLLSMNMIEKAAMSPNLEIMKFIQTIINQSEYLKNKFSHCINLSQSISHKLVFH